MQAYLMVCALISDAWILKTMRANEQSILTTYEATLQEALPEEIKSVLSSLYRKHKLFKEEIEDWIRQLT